MPSTPPQLVARGNIKPSRFVMLDTANDHSGLQATANAEIAGVAQEGSNQAPLSDLVMTTYAAQAGESFRLFGDGDECLIEAGSAIVRGDRLKADSDGRGVPIASSGTTLQNIGAVAQASAAAAGEKIRCSLTTHRSERPALA